MSSDKIYRNNKIDIIFLSAIVLAALLIRLLVLSVSDNLSGDATTRALMGKWVAATCPVFIKHTWLPLHFYLMGITHYIWPEFPVNLRLMHTLFGVAVLVPYYMLVKITVNRAAAVFASIILVVSSIHVILSTQTLPMVIFIFFLFSAFYFFFKFLLEENLSTLALSGVLLTISCGFRYEGWIFIPVLSGFLINRKSEYLIIFMGIAYLFPLFWVMENYVYTGNALNFIDVLKNDINTRMQSSISSIKILKQWFFLFFQHYTFPMVFTAIIGLFYSVIRKTCIFMVILAGSALIILTPLIAGGIIVVTEKYTLIIALLLFPYSYLGLKYLFAKIKGRYFKIYVLPVFLGLIITLNAIRVYSALPKVPDEINGMARVMKQRFNNDTAVVIDDWQWMGCYMLAQTGLNFEGPGLCSTDPEKVFLGSGYYGSFSGKEKLIDFLRNKKPRYLLYSFNGKFPEIFNFSGKKMREEKFGYKFYRIAKNNYFCLYKIYNNEGGFK